ncbi:MAG: hypothetical protein C0485_13190 [Pirellula sp.]|nr:hypothetical protein [Pirellula sp.]
MINRGELEKRREIGTIHASRRTASSVDVERNGRGDVMSVRIGRWRTLTASAQRRIAEVRELHCDRVAVRLASGSEGDSRMGCEIWQLYDLQGQLLASLQTSLDGRLAVVSDYESRKASRLVRNRRGEMETAESWSI